MPLQDVQEPGQLIPQIWPRRQSDVNAFDGLGLHIGQRFDLGAADLRPFIAAVNRAGDADEALGRDEIDPETR
jgi:hypothetical protein